MHGHNRNDNLRSIPKIANPFYLTPIVEHLDMWVYSLVVEWS